MKTLTRLLLIVFAVAILSFNLKKNLLKHQTTTLTLNNITALQASASEVGCDNTTQSYCEASLGAVTVRGTGQPFINF
ncbi:hypothetical protein ACVW2L_000574 [Mucilaginibacter sp. HD30]